MSFVRKSIQILPLRAGAYAVVRTPASARFASLQPQGKDPKQSQGHASSPLSNESHQDVQSEQVHSGYQTSEAASKVPSGSAGPAHDAAAARKHGAQKADRAGLSGNPENIGFAEQVGGASHGDAQPRTRSEGAHGEEESRPPGFLASLGSALGMGTSTSQAKGHNRVGPQGGGRSDRSRQFHTSTASSFPNGKVTRGRAPEAAGRPQEATFAEQNEHLHHKRDLEQPDKGKGNAGEEPVLPSHRREEGTLEREVTRPEREGH